jgi:DNA repair protein RadA/Sms
MKPKKIVFVCSKCGCEQPKWRGQCPDCTAWNTLVEEIAKEGFSRGNNAPGMASRGKFTPITEVQYKTEQRVFCGVPEMDRVLGGGLVQGSLVLLSGDPGIGKSTLLLQALFGLASRGYTVLYASGEESAQQIKLRAERLGTLHQNILITNETDLEMVLSSARSAKPNVLVIDSIQTMSHPSVPSSPGSVTQIRECTNSLLEFAKGEGITTLIVGHVTKEGNIAGPKVLEHLVDTCLYLEGEPSSGFRILRAVKNRFGSTGEIGVFAMQGSGLKDVPNPSALFLEGHKAGLEGSAVAISMEGTRPLLVEVQTLVGKSTFSTPRRTVTGLDPNRFTILLAVIEKRAGLMVSSYDIYANVAGGLRLVEPAMDLALAAAVTSSFFGKPLSGRAAYFGEVGLSGEVRMASFAVSRVQEALKMGFDKVYLPKANYLRERADLEDLMRRFELKIQLMPIENVHEVAGLDVF